MTDKEIFEKLEAEIERLENYENESVTDSDTRFGWIHGKTFALTSIRVLLDSMQKEPVRIKKGCKYRCLSDMQNTDTGAIGFFKDKIYSAPEDDTLVSEENGWLCDISENSSNFELVEEPVSEDYEKALNSVAITFLQEQQIVPNFYADIIMKAVKRGANWQKEQLMAKAVDIEVKVDAGGYPYIPQMELYDYEKDIPLAKEGDKVKVLVIKQE